MCENCITMSDNAIQTICVTVLFIALAVALVYVVTRGEKN